MMSWAVVIVRIWWIGWMRSRAWAWWGRRRLVVRSWRCWVFRVFGRFGWSKSFLSRWKVMRLGKLSKSRSRSSIISFQVRYFSICRVRGSVFRNCLKSTRIQLLKRPQFDCQGWWSHFRTNSHLVSSNYLKCFYSPVYKSSMNKKHTALNSQHQQTNLSTMNSEMLNLALTRLNNPEDWNQYTN